MAEVCRLILNRDKFNSNELDGKAALLYAVEYDYPRVLRELSFKGLDLDLTDNEGKTAAVFYANQNRSMDALCELIGELARFNLDEIDGKAALLYAAEHDNSRVIRQLYFEGLDLDLTDNESKTAVFYANQNRSMVALCDLIVGGAEFDLNRIDGKSAFLMLLRKT